MGFWKDQETGTKTAKPADKKDKKEETKAEKKFDWKGYVPEVVC